MSDNKNENVIFIHIPKTGGVFVLNFLYKHNRIKGIHLPLKNYGSIEGKFVLFCIRNPILWYESLFNFFKHTELHIKNPFKHLVAPYKSINSFLNILLTQKSSLKNNYEYCTYDKYYFSSTNKYGLLTNYLLFFFDYDGSVGVYHFLKNIKKKYHCFYNESLTKDLVKFCKKYNIKYNEDLIDEKLNNTSHTYTINPSAKSLIYRKEKPIYDIFYPQK